MHPHYYRLLQFIRLLSV